MLIDPLTGNQVAIRSHLGGPPHSVVADMKSHIVSLACYNIVNASDTDTPT